MNLIEKYLAKAAGKESVAPGQDITCKVSFVGAHDVTAPVAIRMFREIGVKKVFDPERVALIAEEFADVMMYGLQLARTLGIDVTEQVLRKIDIVDHRPPKPYNPAR